MLVLISYSYGQTLAADPAILLVDASLFASWPFSPMAGPDF